MRPCVRSVLYISWPLTYHVMQAAAVHHWDRPIVMSFSNKQNVPGSGRNGGGEGFIAAT